MTIKNKDGSIFRLRGPNPLTQEQNLWEDDSDLVLHNMDWKAVEMPNSEEVQQFNSDIKEVVVEKEPPITKEKPPIPVVAPEVKKEAKPKPKMRNAVDIWCLPAIIRQRRDPLYDQITRTIEYGQKVMFEGIVVANDGLTMTFWTNVEIPQKGSIIFVARNSVGDAYLEKRWWQVEKVIDETEEARLKESGGFLYYCVPSAYTPDFS